MTVSEKKKMVGESSEEMHEEIAEMRSLLKLLEQLFPISASYVVRRRRRGRGSGVVIEDLRRRTETAEIRSEVT